VESSGFRSMSGRAGRVDVKSIGPWLMSSRAGPSRGLAERAMVELFGLGSMLSRLGPNPC